MADHKLPVLTAYGVLSCVLMYNYDVPPVYHVFLKKLLTTAHFGVGVIFCGAMAA